MESLRSKCIESIDRHFYNIPPIPRSVQFVLASPDRETAPQISPSRKYSQPLFSMKAWSDRATKTSLSGVRGPLRHIRISDKLAHSFLERWARQLAYYWGSGMGQKSIVQYQLLTESLRSKCIESIDRHFYNISPIPGSLHLVLTSPDAEIAPQNLPISKIPQLVFIPPHHHFALQSEHFGERNLDQFSAPNSPVLPICP